MSEFPALPTPPEASSRNVRAVMQGNRSKDTRPEAAIRSAVHRSGLRFRKHARPLSTLRCEADLVFRRQRVAVFIDGCFWHGCPEHGRRPGSNPEYWNAKIGRNIARDRRNDTTLHEAGWTVVRVWEHEPIAVALDRIKRAVASASEACGG